MELVKTEGFKGHRLNGRKKGSVNRSNAEIKERFKMLVDDHLDNLNDDLQSLDAKDRINAILQLAKYVLPQMRSIAVKEIDKKDIEPITFIFGNE